MSSVNKDSFNSYFHISMPFFSWFRLIPDFWYNVGQERESVMSSVLMRPFFLPITVYFLFLSFFILSDSTSAFITQMFSHVAYCSH